MQIGKERCWCKQPGCTTWWLTGIGRFVQGSGFDEQEADRIIAALDGDAGQLAKALIQCLQLIDDMIPGVRHIVLPDYSLLNEALLEGKRALVGTCKTPEQRALDILTKAWYGKGESVSHGARRNDILLALQLIVRGQASEKERLEALGDAGKGAGKQRARPGRNRVRNARIRRAKPRGPQGRA